MGPGRVRQPPTVEAVADSLQEMGCFFQREGVEHLPSSGRVFASWFPAHHEQTLHEYDPLAGE